MKKLILPVVILIVAFAGCNEATQDASKSGQSVDRSPAHVVAMPDHFNNVATKCDGYGHRIFVNGKDLFALPDPKCN